MEERSLSSLVPYSATDKLYIRAKVLIRFRPQDDEFHFVLREKNDVDSETRINVHLKGRYAKACSFIMQDDTLVMSGFVVEPATATAATSNDELYATTKIVVDESRSNAGIAISAPTLTQTVNKARQDQKKGTAGKGKGKEKAKNRAELEYTALIDAQAGARSINVYGVLTYVKPSGPTRGSDYQQSFTLKDPSWPDAANDDGLKCSLFHRKEALLPDSAQVGDIVRLNRVNIIKYNSQLQVANAGKATSMVAFSGRVGDPVDRSAARAPHLNINSWSAQDERKIKELRQWAEQQRGHSNLGIDTCVRTFAELNPREQPDILCQVLHLQPNEQRNRFFRFTVCDGQ
eukprot:gene5301-18283_t